MLLVNFFRRRQVLVSSVGLLLRSERTYLYIDRQYISHNEAKFSHHLACEARSKRLRPKPARKEMRDVQVDKWEFFIALAEPRLFQPALNIFRDGAKPMA